MSATNILTINAGSSSIRFSLRDASNLHESARGKLDRIHGPEPTLTLSVPSDSAATPRPFNLAGRPAPTAFVDALGALGLLESVSAVGHRIVHGMDCAGPTLIDARLVERLRALAVHDRQHLPLALDLIAALGERLPQATAVACFDTSFHRSIPRFARVLPIPRRFTESGVQRYGFHGLSFAYALEELARTSGGTEGRIILAHLGSGSSLAAVRDGACVDTTMGFTPTGGVPMSSRSGDLDPGVLFAMARAENLGLERLESIVENESGLIGISETSGDVRDLLSREADDPRAAEALQVFCHQVRKAIGAMAAAQGGLDTLVFTGGIGENAAVIRSRICRGLEFLGVTVDEARNSGHAGTISSDGSRVTVRVVATDEERMIARETRRLSRRSDI